MDSTKVLNTNMSFAQTSDVNQGQMALSLLAMSTSVELWRQCVAFVRQVAQEIWVRFQLRAIWLMGRKCPQKGQKLLERPRPVPLTVTQKAASGCKTLRFPRIVVSGALVHSAGSELASKLAGVCCSSAFDSQTVECSLQKIKYAGPSESELLGSEWVFYYRCSDMHRSCAASAPDMSRACWRPATGTAQLHTLGKHSRVLALPPIPARSYS